MTSRKWLFFILKEQFTIFWHSELTFGRGIPDVSARAEVVKLFAPYIYDYFDSKKYKPNFIFQ